MNLEERVFMRRIINLSNLPFSVISFVHHSPQLTTSVETDEEDIRDCSVVPRHVGWISARPSNSRRDGPETRQISRRCLVGYFRLSRLSRQIKVSFLHFILCLGPELMVSRGRYRIGPRGSVELETYLKKEYEGNVYACNRCSKLVLIVSSMVTLIATLVAEKIGQSMCCS